MKPLLLNRLAAITTIAMMVSWPLDSSATTMLSMEPSSHVVNVGDNFALNVSIANVTDLFSYQFDVIFDPAVLTAHGIEEGAFLASGGDDTFFIPGTIDNVAGLITFTANSLVGAIAGLDGSGVLTQLEFSAVGVGASSVNLAAVILQDSALQDIAADLVPGSVLVQDGAAVPESSSLWLLALGIGVLGASQSRGRLLSPDA